MATAAVLPPLRRRLAARPAPAPAATPFVPSQGTNPNYNGDRSGGTISGFAGGMHYDPPVYAPTNMGTPNFGGVGNPVNYSTPASVIGGGGGPAPAATSVARPVAPTVGTSTPATPVTPAPTGFISPADLNAKWQQAQDEAKAANAARDELITKGYSTQAATATAQHTLEQENAQKLYENAKAEEQARQDALQKGYQQRQASIMGQFEGAGLQEQADIRNSARAAGATAQANLNARGLGGTTIGNSLAAGNLRNQNAELGRLGERLRGQRIAAETNLSGDTLGSLERGGNRIGGLTQNYGNTSLDLLRAGGANQQGINQNFLNYKERISDNYPSIDSLIALNSQIGKSGIGAGGPAPIGGGAVGGGGSTGGGGGYPPMGGGNQRPPRPAPTQEPAPTQNYGAPKPPQSSNAAVEAGINGANIGMQQPPSNAAVYGGVAGANIGMNTGAAGMGGSMGGVIGGATNDQSQADWNQNMQDQWNQETWGMQDQGYGVPDVGDRGVANRNTGGRRPIWDARLQKWVMA